MHGDRQNLEREENDMRLAKIRLYARRLLGRSAIPVFRDRRINREIDLEADRILARRTHVPSLGKGARVAPADRHDYLSETLDPRN
jgi:hypothetical protein